MNPDQRCEHAPVRLCSRRHIGLRDAQQDQCSWLHQGTRSLFVVADGMGGHENGEQASNAAVQTFLEAFAGHAAGKPRDILETALREAHHRVREGASDRGTTVVAAIIDRAGPMRLTYTWVGDSRLYLVSDSGQESQGDAIPAARDVNGAGALWLLTRDDSLVWNLFASGDLGLDDLARHPMKNRLLHSIHSRDTALPVRMKEIVLQEGDMLLLCTDGVWESFGSQADLFACFSRRSSEAAHQALSSHLDRSLEAAGAMDNNTYLLIQPAIVGRGEAHG